MTTIHISNKIYNFVKRAVREAAEKESLFNPNFCGDPIDVVCDDDGFTWVDCRDRIKGASLLVLINNIIADECGETEGD